MLANQEKGNGDQLAGGNGTDGAPSLSLPKGGGAIRDIGEKFSVNAVTGTASFSVPIFTTPSRSDFYPSSLFLTIPVLATGPLGLAGGSPFHPSLEGRTRGYPGIRTATIPTSSFFPEPRSGASFAFERHKLDQGCAPGD